ncbi:MAG: Hsp20/alpha crystallin family protein [bacterium]|nr:Hsp20/alpha crystallin family protein [bacterium]
MKGLTRWDPFRELTGLHRDMDSLFRSTFGDRGRFGRGLGHLIPEGEAYPMMECYTKDEHFYLKAHLPGIDPKDVEISIVGDRLTLKGETKADKNVKEEDYWLREVRYGTFERTVTLPEAVDPAKIHASYEEGMLTVTAPVTEAIKSKKIPIQIGKKGAQAA